MFTPVAQGSNVEQSICLLCLYLRETALDLHVQLARDIIEAWSSSPVLLPEQPQKPNTPSRKHPSEVIKADKTD